MDCWTVYRHISPSGKIYIGITSRDPKRRWNCGKSYEHCVKFYAAIQKYGWDNIKHEILFTSLSEERAKKLEIELIRHYKWMSISYNLTDGGDGWLGYHHSDVTKEKLSLLNSGENNPMYGKHLSEEAKQKLREQNLGELNPMFGKAHSEEAKQNISQKNKKPKPEGFGDKIRKARSKPIEQYDKEGNLIACYESSKQAGAALSYDNSSITKCCNGKLAHYKGYIWKYKE